MTPEQLNEIEERAKAATPAVPYSRHYRIVTADIPALIAALRQERAELLATLSECEWTSLGLLSEDYCPMCWEGISTGHKPDCRLANALKGATK